MNSQSEWQCCASHLGYSLYDPLETSGFFSVPLVREKTTSIGFCVPFSTAMSLYGSHMGHFQILGVHFPLDYASDATQRSRHTVYYRGMILYGTSIVFPVESRPSTGRLLTGRTCEPLGGGSCSITNAALTQLVTLGLFSDIVVMEYSSATAQHVNVFAYEEVEKSAPWTRYQLNSNADDGHLGVKPRL
jgi:hypothetical protein